MLNVSSRELATELADRLNGIVPCGFVVHVQDSDLVVMHEERVVGVSGAPAIMDSVEAIKHPRENLESAVRAALSGVQDYIADTTSEPWPGSGGTQPNPDARVVGDRVRLWFGSEESSAGQAAADRPDLTPTLVSHATYLAGLDLAQLTEPLERRPDALVEPAPRIVAELAERLPLISGNVT